MASKNLALNTSRSVAGRIGAGPTLMLLGVALFVVTRIVVWLPLGFLGTWINGILWPVLILSLLVGAGMTYLKLRKG